MKALNGFVFLSLAIFPLIASAHHRPTGADCLTEIVNPVSKRSVVTSKCLMSQPLTTAWTRKEFPGLDAHEYPVEYYRGEFETRKTVTEVTSHKIYDACNGRFISDANVSNEEEQIQTFTVRNPNLDDSVAATFQLVKMTRDEAATEMNYQYQLCRSTP